MAAVAPPINCTQDADCQGNLVCYSNVSWAPNGCSCSTYYDWQAAPGQNLTADPFCVEFGVGVIVRLVVGGIAITVSASLAAAALVDVLRLARLGPLHLDASLTTLLLQMTSFIFATCYQATHIASTLAPSAGVLLLFGNGDKYQQYAQAEYATLAIQLLFATWAALHVSLMWLELGWRHHRGIASKTSNVSPASVKLVVFLESAWVVLCIGIMGTGNFQFIGVAAVPVLVALGIVYARAGYELTKLLEMSQRTRAGHMSANITADNSSTITSSSTEGAVRHSTRTVRPTTRDSSAIRSVRFTVVNVSFSLFVQTGLAAGYIVTHVLYDWRESFLPGQVGPGLAFLLLEHLAILYTGWGIFHYCHKGTMAKLRRARDSNNSKAIAPGRNAAVASTSPSSQVSRSDAASR